MIKPTTPRTNEAAKRAVDLLTACKSADDMHAATKQIILDMLRTLKELELRVVELEAQLRAVFGLTVESGVKRIVETMNTAEGAIPPKKERAKG